MPGGSSGGSGAALGADLCLGALGTDTGGSVRIPAALNGVSALRPTYGLVSTRGTFPVSAALDTIGPMARSIADVAEMLAVMAGYDRDDPHAVEHAVDDPRAGLHAGVAGLRVGLPRRFFFEDVDPAILRNTQAAADVLAGLGAEVVDVDLDGADEATGIATLLIRAEATGLHRERLAEDPERLRRRRPAPPGARQRGDRPGRRPRPGQDARLARAHAAGLRRRGPAADAHHQRDRATARGRRHDRRHRRAHPLHLRVEPRAPPGRVDPLRRSTAGGCRRAPSSQPPPGATRWCCAPRTRVQEATDWHRRRPPAFGS